MNHIHRIIWNEYSDSWVAVPETARSRGKGGGRSSRKVLAAALIASGFSIASVSALAEPPATTVLPAGGKTNAFISANGVPVVNIDTANAAGLSHNRFTRYDIESNGLVLNNGNVSQVFRQSQLAGQVPANLNLTQEAKVILNEVVSTNRSTLAGFTEVLGGKADVIVANPNGITCNGCGFINTDRATLTTGTSNIGSDGSLTGFTVNRGDILIEGAGANASGQQIFDLVARSVKVNGEVHVNAAGSLGVTTGHNVLDYASRNVTASATASGGVPGFSFDSAALGGMYAGRIRIIATEAGVGVRMLGKAAASADDFTLSAAGNIEMNAQVSAEQSAHITNANNSFDNQGSIITNADTTINVGSLINGSSTNTDALIWSSRESGSGSINVADELVNYGAMHSDGDLSIEAARILNADTGGISSSAKLDLKATVGSLFFSDIENRGALYAGEAMNLRTPIAPLFAVAISDIYNAPGTGTINSNGSITINTDYLFNYHQIVADGAVVISASRDFYNETTTANGGSLRKEDGAPVDISGTTSTRFHNEGANYSGMNVSRFENEFSRTEQLVGMTMQELKSNKTQLISNTSIEIKDYFSASNKAAIISAPSVTLTGKNGASVFTNESFDLISSDYTRRALLIQDVYFSLNDPLYADYMLYVRTDPDAVEAPIDGDHENYNTYLPGKDWTLNGWSLLSSADSQSNAATIYNASAALVDEKGVAGGVNSGNDRVLAENQSGAGIYANTVTATNGSLVNSGAISPVVLPKSRAFNTEPSDDKVPTNPNGYFVVSSNSEADYLIETNPLFRVGTAFVGSDYMVETFGYNPETPLKRLGDDNYEAYLIRQQLISQTGNNILAGYVNEADQMKTLMDQAYEADQAAGGKGDGFTFGKALTPEQIANLGKDIVWMVETEVQGVKVLKPVVYLSSITRYGINAGAVIAGDNINMNLRSVSNAGGSISASNKLEVITSGDITNTSGSIKGGSVDLTSTGGSIVNQTQVQGAGDGVTFSTGIGKTATIESTGAMNLDANKDIKIIGAKLRAEGDATLAAGNNITVDTIVDKTVTTTGSAKSSAYSQTMTVTNTTTETNTGSSISIGGNANLTAGNQIIVRGSDVDIVGEAVVDGKNGVKILDAVDKVRTTTVTQSRSMFTTGSGPEFDAPELANDPAKTSESDSTSGPGFAKASAEAEEKAEASGSADFKLSETTTTVTEAGADTSVSSNFKVGGKLKIITTDTLTVQGSNVESGGDMTLEAKNVEVLSGQNKEWSTTTTTRESIGLYTEGNAEANASAGAGAAAGSAADLMGLGADANAAVGADASASGTATLGARSETEITTHDKVTNIGSSLKSGGSLKIDAQQNATFVGAAVESTDDMTINASNIINRAAQDTETNTSYKSSETGGLYIDASAEAGTKAEAQVQTSGSTALAGGLGNGAGAGGEITGKAETSAGARYETKTGSSSDKTVTNKVNTFKSGGNFTRTATAGEENGVKVDGSIVDQGTQVEAGGNIKQTARVISDEAVHDVTNSTKDYESHDVRAGAYAGGEAEASAQADVAALGRKDKGTGSGAEASKGAKAKYEMEMSGSTSETKTAVTSKFKAGGAIESTSDENTTLVGTTFESGGDVTIKAKTLEYNAAQDSTTNTFDSTEASLEAKNAKSGSKGVKREAEIGYSDKGNSSTTAKVGSIKAGGNLTITTTGVSTAVDPTAGNATFVGTSLEAGNRATIESSGKVDFQAARNTESSTDASINGSASMSKTKENKGRNADFGGAYETGSEDTAIVGTIKSGAGGTTIKSASDVTLTGTQLNSAGETLIESTTGTVSLKAAETKTTGAGIGGSAEYMNNQEGPGLYKKGDSEKAGALSGNLEERIEKNTTSIQSGGRVTINAEIIKNEGATLESGIDEVKLTGKVESTQASGSNISIGDSVGYKSDASMGE